SRKFHADRVVGRRQSVKPVSSKLIRERLAGGARLRIYGAHGCARKSGSARIGDVAQNEPCCGLPEKRQKTEHDDQNRGKKQYAHLIPLQKTPFPRPIIRFGGTLAPTLRR